jgi:glycolate oxidase iron-sulfur subunit
LAAHTGAVRQAQAFARRNLRAFPADVDAIVTNAAGCGSGLHEYPLWLRGEPEQAAAEAFAKRAQDVSVFLANLGCTPPRPLTQARRVALHDACHLVHAQRVRRQPRQLLWGIGNLDVVDIPSGDVCCGSAGTYNIEHPEAAAELGRRKAEAILTVAADAVIMGNIGCMTQVQSHLQRLGSPVPVLHTMQLLDRCYRAETDPTCTVP